MHRLGAFTILLLLLAGPLPAAGTPDDVAARNRAHFLALASEAYDPDALVELATGAGTRVVTMADAADLFAARAGALDVSAWSTQATRSHESPEPMAGTIWLLEEYSSTYFNPTSACDRGGQGSGGHYDHALKDPETLLPYPYVGVARSNVATYGTGIATLYDPVDGIEAIGYRAHTFYTGNSDFWCLSFEGPGAFVINFPFVHGVVVFDEVEYPCVRHDCPLG